MGTPDQIGPYRILGELGRGGMGVVYRAHRADLDREFALKLVLPGGSEEAALARLRREAQAAARLAGHPGIVGVHDLGEHDGALYVAMDLVEGRPLDALVAEEPLAPQQAAVLGAQIARAVAFAHAAGILHRDLKPGNVLIDGAGNARVTDFGLARFQAADAELTRLTQSGEILGTPAYMAPEQATGAGVDARADVYAVGALLYECVAGHPPFTEDSVYRVIARVLRDPPPPLTTAAPGCPAPLAAVIHRCLAKKPEGRYASAQALAEDLDRFARGEAVQAAPLRRGGRARRGWAAAGLVISGAGLAAAVWFERPAGGSDGVAAATAARTAAERTQGLGDAWRRLATETGDPMRTLMAAGFRARIPRAERAAARDAIDGAVASVRAQPGSGRLPDAWAAFAAFLDGERGALDRLADLRAGAGGDPFPAGLHALALVTRYAQVLDLPQFKLTAGGVVRHERPATPRLRGARTAAREALALAETAGDWGGLAHGRELHRLARGAALLVDGELQAAADALSGLVEDPLLGTHARLLRASARIRTDDLAGAGADFEAVVAARWAGAAPLASATWISHGLARLAAHEPHGPSFERALAALQLAASHGLAPGTVARNRGSVLHAWARAERAAGRPPEAKLVAAVREFETAAADGKHDFALEAARARFELAERRVEGGQDQRDALAASVREFEALVASPGDTAPPHETLALARALLGRQRAQLGGDWRSPLERAVTAMESLAQAGTASGSLGNTLATVLLEVAQLPALPAAERAVRYEQAAAAMERALDAHPADPRLQDNCAKTYVLWGQFLVRQKRPATTQLDRGLELFDRLVAAKPGDWQRWRDRASLRKVRGGAAAGLEAALAEFDAGERDVRRALELAPGHPHAWHTLCLLLAGRAVAVRDAGRDAAPAFQAAIRELDAMLAAVPDHPRARLDRAEAWLESVRDAAARGVDPRPAYARAAADLEAHRRYLPRDPGLHARLGAIHATLGDLAAARRWYGEALRLRPGWPAVQRALAQLDARERRR